MGDHLTNPWKGHKKTTQKKVTGKNLVWFIVLCLVWGIFLLMDFDRSEVYPPTQDANVANEGFDNLLNYFIF